MRHRVITIALLMGLSFATAVRGGEETGRYFEQLRRRGLFSVAEHYALSGLSDPQLAAASRVELTVELSRTFADHAAMVSPQQRDELWTKARDVVQEALAVAPSLPRAELLRTQLGLVAARRAEVLRWDAMVAGSNRRLHESAFAAIEESVGLLRREMEQIDAGLKQRRHRDHLLTAHEARHLLEGLHAEVGNLERQRAMLLPPESADRASALVEAQAAYREALSGATDPRRIAIAKIGLADCTRLLRDFPRAREMCAAILKTQPPLDADLRHAVQACQLRCFLDDGQPLAAAEAFLDLRRTEPTLPGELWLIQLQTLLQLLDAAEKKQDAEVSGHLRAEAELVLIRVDEQAGGAWSVWCRQLWNHDRFRWKYGEALSSLVTRAQSAHRAGDRAVAARLYAEAVATARQQSEPELAFDLAYTRGSLLLELKDFVAAADAFTELVKHAPDHERTASADLLAAYALGRSYEEQRTQARRLAYTSALERHIQQFPEGDTTGDARFMLAQLHEQRLQFSQALPLYLDVADSHARSVVATAGAARCYVNLLVRLKSLHQEATTFHAQAVAELDRRIAGWTASSWSPAHGEALLQLVKLRLLSDPPEAPTAAALLEQFDRHAATAKDEAEAWKALRQQAVPLKLVAWAGAGRSVQARQLLTTAALQTPSDLFAVVTGLDQLAAGRPDGQYVDLTELLVDAVQRLEPLRERLPAEARWRFDLARIRAYLVSGRVPRALAVAQTAPEDVAHQREVAELLLTSRDPAAMNVAKTGWQRVQTLTPAGSSEWMTARLSEIEAHLSLGDRTEAVKLLRLTRLLYPDIGSAALQERFADLERRAMP